MLLDAGADLNARNNDDSTPLHIAARWGRNPAVIIALLEGGADPKQRNDEGVLPYEWALKNKHFIGTEVLLRLKDASLKD